MQQSKIQNLKLIGISTLFLMATVIGLTTGYFSSRKIADDKTVGGKPEQKITLNVQSAKLTKAGLARIRNDIVKLQNAKVKDGVTGKQGERGVQGVGVQGGRGPTGDIGPTGPIGKRGLTGRTGAQGRKGDKGIPGERGPEGLKLKNVVLLISEIIKKVSKIDAEAELLKVLTTADPTIRNALYNVLVKPGLKTAYLDNWIDQNKHKTGGIVLTNDIHRTDESKNSFFKMAGHVFTDLRQSNSYLFKNLNGGINKRNRYGLFVKLNLLGAEPVRFYLKKYSELSPGVWQQLLGFDGKVNRLSSNLQIDPLNRKIDEEEKTEK